MRSVGIFGARSLVVFLTTCFATSFLNAQELGSPSYSLYSTILKEEREIQIHLPESYHHSKQEFPVLFVLDGEYIFDFAKGTVDFLTNDFGFLPDMIVVGVPNTDRNRDLTVSLEPNGSYLNFISFLTEELGPHIQKNYRTNGFHILYGWSSGAGIANYCLVKKSTTFDAYILAGSGIGPKTEAFIKQEMGKATYEGIFLFASSEGTTPRAKGLEKHQTILQEIDPTGLEYGFQILENTDHVGAMAKGLYGGLEFVFSSYRIPNSIIGQGTEAILEYYSGLQEKYGFKTEIPLGAINEISGVLAYQKKTDEAIKLLDHGLELYTNADVLWAVKAEILLGLKKIEEARESYEKALESAHSKLSKNKYRAIIKGLN